MKYMQFHNVDDYSMCTQLEHVLLVLDYCDNVSEILSL